MASTNPLATDSPSPQPIGVLAVEAFERFKERVPCILLIRTVV